MYEINIRREFSAAHAIRLYDGQLEPFHGHNWAVETSVGSEELDAIEVVMDFHVLETRLDELMNRVHNRSLNDVPPFADERGGLAVNPTAERVAWWIGESVREVLPDHVQLLAVRVGEAPGCAATYRPSPISGGSTA